MRRIYSFVIALFFLGLMLVACSPKAEKEEVTESEDSEWIGMDDFHMVMAESFHPFRDSANLEPAKALAKEMVAAAEQWISNERPKRVATDEVGQLMNDLKAEAESLAAMVEQGSDEEIGESLTRLHDIFHHLQEKWYTKEHEEGH